MANPKGIPEGYHTVTPTLVCKNCSAAIDFYKKAFGAQERFRLNSPDGKVAHAELQIGDSVVMLGEEMDMPGCARSPQTLGGHTGTLYIYVPDVDAAYNKAVQAGAKASQPVQDMFWGDRFGAVTDPFGHAWGLGTQKEKLTPQQIEERAHEFFAKMAQQQKRGAA